MPNWVENRLVITGDKAVIDEIQERMAKPYVCEHYDFMKQTYEPHQTEGDFLLWNIIAPTDMDSYLQKTENAIQAEERNKQSGEPVQIGKVIDDLANKLADFSMENVIEKFNFEVKFGEDWYHWNLRNWGTKWEIGNNASVLSRADNKIVYRFATAWAPPVEALNKLAGMYPSVTMDVRFHDEGDCFAGEVFWENGEQSYDNDLEIDHGLLQELYGECYACDPENDWDDDGDMQERYKCAEYNKFAKDLENV